MGITTFQGIPLSWEAGDTVAWTENFADFPNTAWTAKLAIEMGTSAPVVVDATNSGNDFLFTIPRTTSAGIPPGDYDFSIYCYSTGGALQRARAKTGTLTVLPDLTQALTPSFAEQQVTALQTVLATFATTAYQSVSFNGQSYSRGNISEYQKSLAYWEARVIAEQAKLAAQRGAPDPGRVQTRFGDGFWEIPFIGPVG